MIELTMDTASESLVAQLLARPAAIELAGKRAVRKLVLWLQRRLLQQVSRETGVKQKDLQAYRRVNVKIAGLSGEVWIGLKELPLHLSGNVSWSPGSPGARVKGKTYAGAFYRHVYSPERKVWIRSARNREEGHATYHQKGKYHRYAGPEGGRFPIELLGAELEPAAGDLDRRIEQEAKQRFATLYRQELNYVIHHAGN